MGCKGEDIAEGLNETEILSRNISLERITPPTSYQFLEKELDKAQVDRMAVEKLKDTALVWCGCIYSSLSNMDVHGDTGKFTDVNDF